MEALGNAIEVEELKHIEVEQVKAVAAFADEKKRPPGEDCRDGVRATQAEHEGGEDGSHQAAVHEEVWGAVNHGVKEETDCPKAQGGEDEALS
jgi:hypothetical protein